MIKSISVAVWFESEACPRSSSWGLQTAQCVSSSPRRRFVSLPLHLPAPALVLFSLAGFLTKLKKLGRHKLWVTVGSMADRETMMTLITNYPPSSSITTFIINYPPLSPITTLITNYPPSSPITHRHHQLPTIVTKYHLHHQLPTIVTNYPSTQSSLAMGAYTCHLSTCQWITLLASVSFLVGSSGFQ